MGLKSDPDVRTRDFVHDRIQALRRVEPGGVDFHDLGMGNTIVLYLGLVERAQVALHLSAEVQVPFREVWVRRRPQVQWAYGRKQRIVVRKGWLYAFPCDHGALVAHPHRTGSERIRLATTAFLCDLKPVPTTTPTTFRV